MSEDVWSERDTTPDAIEAALRELLRHRHAEDSTAAPARVLNLVVIVDRDWKGEIANRLERVGRYHASRTILCTVEQGREAIDATAVMSTEGERSGICVLRENVEIDIGPHQVDHLATIVDAVLVSELPTMLWSPHGHDGAVRSLLGMVDVVLVDSDDHPDPADGLAIATDLGRSAYVVDLAWLRTTPWRERIAAAFDLPSRRPAMRALDQVQIRYQPTSAASAALLAGWLASRLGWNGSGAAVKLEPFEQESPGLAGVTLSWASASLSLDRAAGGLQAREYAPGGQDRRWRVLGASRGEGGILGEGVRQALLRDPTYAPALAAARELRK